MTSSSDMCYEKTTCIFSMRRENPSNGNPENGSDGVLAFTREFCVMNLSIWREKLHRKKPQFSKDCAESLKFFTKAEKHQL